MNQPFSIKMTSREGYPVLKLSGAFAAEGFAKLRESLKSAFESRNDSEHYLLVDASDATLFTSSCLETVYSASKEAEKRKWRCAVIDTKGDIKQLFSMTGFDRLIPVFESFERFCIETPSVKSINKAEAPVALKSEFSAQKNVSILVVDDEPEIRSILYDFLSEDEGYTVFTAENGRDALDNVLSKNHVDLVLSDINMPVMKGFELLGRVKELYPLVKRVLITAYNVEDYIDMAFKYDIGNIFVKTTPFNFNELSTMLNNLIRGDIFGIDRYFPSNCVRSEFSIKRGDAIDRDVNSILEVLPDKGAGRKLNLALGELITNAVFYGIRGENPSRKDKWEFDFELEDKDAIKITVCRDNSKYGIAITDNGGRLKKQDVLYWMHRQSARDDSGAPLGVNDSHGRGFFIARRYIDRLIVNVAKNSKTEIIIINHTGEKYQGSKPLFINEI